MAFPVFPETVLSWFHCFAVFSGTNNPIDGVALHVKPDKTPELKRETFTA